MKMYLYCVYKYIYILYCFVENILFYSLKINPIIQLLFSPCSTLIEKKKVLPLPN